MRIRRGKALIVLSIYSIVFSSIYSKYLGVSIVFILLSYDEDSER